MHEQQAQKLEALVTAASNVTAPGSNDLLLFQQLTEAELYASCTRTASGQLSLRTAPAGELAHLLRLFTSSQHPGLGQPYAGIAWTSALQMVLAGTELDGVQIINGRSDWVAWSRGQLRALQAESDRATRT